MFALSENTDKHFALKEYDGYTLTSWVMSTLVTSLANEIRPDGADDAFAAANDGCLPD